MTPCCKSAGFVTSPSCSPTPSTAAHTGPGRRSSQDISAGVAVLVTEAQFPQYNPPWVFERLKEWVKLAKTGQVCDKSISLITVDLRIDALSKRTVESDTAMAEFLKFNAPAQGDCASKAGPARPWRLVLDCPPSSRARPRIPTFERLGTQSTRASTSGWTMVLY